MVGFRGGFAEIAHRAAGLVGVLEPVQEHVIDNPVMTGAVAAARFRQQIGRIGHALHAAGHHDLGRAGADDVMRQHGGLHAGAADLVDRRRSRRVRQFGAARGLPRRSLTLSGRQHTAHEDFVDPFRGQICPLNGGADHMGTELMCAEGRKIAHEPAQRCAGGGNDDNLVGSCGHDGVPVQLKAIALYDDYHL